MKAYLLKKSGGPQTLRLSELPDPQPGDDEVVVRLHYTGINYAEILSRKGLYGWAVKRPYVLGMEGAGVIEAAGSAVAPTRVGERVMVGAQYGCYAEKVAIKAVQAIPTPESLSMAESAAFLVNFMTAWVSLFPLGRLQSGEAVLVTAAAGGVGTAAVQLAARQGTRVYGLAGSAEKIEFLKSLGATEAFNYRQDDCFARLREASGGIDVALEMVGGDVYRQTFDLLNPFARLVVAGFASLNLQKWNPLSWWRTWRDIPRVSLSRMAPQSVAVMATHLGYLLKDPAKMMAIYNDLNTFVDQHGIKPIIGEVFPFERAGDAHAFIESRRSIGKVLLKHDIAE